MTSTTLRPGEPARTASAPASRAAGEFACRAFDLTVALALLVLLAPVLAAIALAVRLDSSGPAIFSQRRLGLDRSTFTVHKFRTMTTGASPAAHRDFVVGLIAGRLPPEQGDGPRFKLVHDPRVTPVGGWLRRTSLDELPQLWNVVRGEMSLVGPRPALAYEVEHYPESWLGRFAVKPGLTGLWQVSGRSQLSMEAMIALDLEYAARRSFALNLSILRRTPLALLRPGSAC